MDVVKSQAKNAHDRKMSNRIKLAKNGKRRIFIGIDMFPHFGRLREKIGFKGVLEYLSSIKERLRRALKC